MEHPGKIELKRILNCMKDYEYDENSLEPGKFDGSYILNLQKRVDYSSDETIKVTIEFSTVFDDKNRYKKDAYENFLYNDKNNKKANIFINKLMNDDSPKKGGQKKKQGKTRKNKK